MIYVLSRLSSIQFFTILLVLLLAIVFAFDWWLYYLLNIRDPSDETSAKRVAISVSVMSLLLFLIFVSGMWMIWKYDRWDLVRPADKVCYLTCFASTAVVLINVVVNWFIVGRLVNDPITNIDLNNAKLASRWAAGLATAVPILLMFIYAIRGWQAQIDSNLFVKTREEYIESFKTRGDNLKKVYYDVSGEIPEIVDKPLETSMPNQVSSIDSLDSEIL